MQLSDPWDIIMARKADEAPDGAAPLIPIATDYTPSAEPPPRITIVGKRIPPVPAPIQIPLLQMVPTPTQPDAWDRITANRAALVQRRDWTGYLPWVAGGLALVAVIALMTDNRRSSPSPRPAARRVSYARRRPARR